MPDYLKKFGLLLILLCGLPLLHAAITAPRTWAAAETPIAFWAWRAQAPTDAEIEQVKQQTGATLLFLRAGQLDDDTANLTAAEIAAAPSDRETTIATELKIERAGHANNALPQQLVINATNTGTAGARLGDGALTIDLRVPPGSLSDITGLSGFASSEGLCDGSRDGAPRPCSMRRANLLRLKARSWPPGARARAKTGFASTLPIKVSARTK